VKCDANNWQGAKTVFPTDLPHISHQISLKQIEAKNKIQILKREKLWDTADY